MTDHPILFSAPMVRAILDGRKTTTRRVLKPQPIGHTAWQDDDTGRWWVSGHGEVGDTLLSLRWRAGDRLWVREAHALVGTTDPGFLLYRASGYEAECDRHGFDKPYPPESVVRWRPSIHMPRWASRITLAVEAVRVERLHAITEEDARAEGVLYVPGHGDITRAELMCDPGWSNFLHCREGFQLLWDTIHGPDAWGANPWVSVTTFRRVE